jgi:hypothetical protein
MTEASRLGSVGRWRIYGHPAASACCICSGIVTNVTATTPSTASAATIATIANLVSFIFAVKASSEAIV